ncbi:hypothetical protein AGMMS49593_10690 [Endomicrobiia bacterium]|nr:hypothetical protein AGMMS49593_10690 [Endomicrobiia bacterium]
MAVSTTASVVLVSPPSATASDDENELLEDALDGDDNEDDELDELF